MLSVLWILSTRKIGVDVSSFDFPAGQRRTDSEITDSLVRSNAIDGVWWIQ
jgi:hypothetical protein